MRAPVLWSSAWTGPVRAVGHLFAARGGMECCDRGYGRTGSIRGGDLATGGGHDLRDPRRPRYWGDHAVAAGARARM